MDGPELGSGSGAASGPSPGVAAAFRLRVAGNGFNDPAVPEASACGLDASAACRTDERVTLDDMRSCLGWLSGRRPMGCFQKKGEVRFDGEVMEDDSMK